ncbi:hypothetical protein TRVA0_020S02344 [Trichomonascus vanleenenianus]|uniref:uncharacterized protein n=1 Tax=Trichomonascus vanleenenianus TaxID=2268995 RepID=UPI003ECA5DF5
MNGGDYTAKNRWHGGTAVGPRAMRDSNKATNYGRNETPYNLQNRRLGMEEKSVETRHRYRKSSETERVKANYELSQKIERGRFDNLVNAMGLNTLSYESIATDTANPVVNSIHEQSPLNAIKHKRNEERYKCSPRLNPISEKITVTIENTSNAMVGDITQSTHSVNPQRHQKQTTEQDHISTQYNTSSPLPSTLLKPGIVADSTAKMGQLTPPDPVPTPPPHKSPLLQRLPQLQHNRHRSLPDVKLGSSVHSNWNLPATTTTVRSVTPSLPGFAETALPSGARKKAGSCIEVRSTGPPDMSCSGCIGACICTSPTGISPRIDTPPRTARRDSQLNPPEARNSRTPNLEESETSPPSGRSDRDRSTMGPYQGKRMYNTSPASTGSTTSIHIMHGDSGIENPQPMAATPSTPSPGGAGIGTMPTPPPHNQPSGPTSRITSPSVAGGNSDWSHSSTEPEGTQKKFAPHIINSTPAAPSPSSRPAYYYSGSGSPRRSTSVVFPSSTYSASASSKERQRPTVHHDDQSEGSDDEDEEDDDSSGEVYFVFRLNWWTFRIMGLTLPGVLVPYIWPTSPSSFFTGILVGFLVAHIRPRIEHYLDIWATYVSSFSRFAIVWGSIGLICWGLLRLIQQTSAATMNIPADPQKLAYESSQTLPPPNHQARPQQRPQVVPQAQPRSRASTPAAQQYESNVYPQQEPRRSKQQQPAYDQSPHLQQEPRRSKQQQPKYEHPQQEPRRPKQQHQQQLQQQPAYDQSPQFEPQYYESDRPRTVHHYHSQQALPRVKKTSSGGSSPHNNVLVASPVSLPPPQAPSHYESLSSPEQSPVRKVRSSASTPRMSPSSSRSPSPGKQLSPVVTSRMQLLQQQEETSPNQRRAHSVVSEPAVPNNRHRAITPVPTSDNASIVTSSRSMTSFDSMATDSSYDSYTTRSSRSSRTSNPSLRSSPSQYSIAPSSSVSNMIKRFSVDESHSYKPYPARPSLVDMQMHEMANLPHSEDVISGEAIRVLEKPRGHSAFRMKR